MKNHFKMWNYTREKQLAIYTEIGKKYNLPRQVIEVICNSPFKFAKERMSDDSDTKSIMFAYLFKIKPKKKYLNEISKTKGRSTRQTEWYTNLKENREDS